MAGNPWRCEGEPHCTDPLYFARGPLKEIANTTHHRRFTEHALPLHTPLYVMGQARERDDALSPEIVKAKGAEQFLISMRTDRQISSGLGWMALLWFLLGLAVMLGGTIAANLIARNSGGLIYAEAAGGFLVVTGIG